MKGSVIPSTHYITRIASPSHHGTFDLPRIAGHGTSSSLWQYSCCLALHSGLARIYQATAWEKFGKLLFTLFHNSSSLMTVLKSSRAAADAISVFSLCYIHDISYLYLCFCFSPVVVLCEVIVPASSVSTADGLEEHRLRFLLVLNRVWKKGRNDH